MNNEDTKALQDRFHAARERSQRARETEAAIYEVVLTLVEHGHSPVSVIDGLHRNLQMLNEAMYPPKAFTDEPVAAGMRLG